MLEQGAHGATVERPIGLGARSPDGGALGAIEHAELNGRAIGGTAHDATQCVYFPNHSALGNATNGRITTHLADGVEDGSQQQRPGTKARRHGSGFGAGVAAANDDYVIVRHGEKLLTQGLQRLDAPTHRGTSLTGFRTIGRLTDFSKQTKQCLAGFRG